MLTIEKNVATTKAALKVSAKTNVVLNDNAKQAKSAKSTINFVSTLAYARKEWQQNAYTKSNNELYALLAECYASYLELCKDSAKAKDMRKQLDDYIAANKLVFKKSTHTLVKVIKCVFGDTDKRRISTYGIVLRTALAQNLKATQIANFIKQSGGVQEIKLARTNALTTKAKAEMTQQFVSKKTLAEVTNVEIAKTLDASKVGQQVVFVATQKANGKFVINAVTNSASAVTSALAACYSVNKEKIKNKKVEDKVAANDDAITKAVELAVA